MNEELPPPLGVHWSPSGCSAAVVTDSGATGVWLCKLVDANQYEPGSNPASSPEPNEALHPGEVSELRYALTHRLGSTWWISSVPLNPGDRYGYRVEGPGHRVTKLLVDPYARAIEGAIDWVGAASAPEMDSVVDGYVVTPGFESGHSVLSGSAFSLTNNIDSSPFVPRSIVIDAAFEWEGDTQLGNSWTQTVIYEVHVKGATKTHPGVPEHLRGTYAGLAHPAFVSHLHSLGVSAVELLPVHHIGHEERLTRMGLTNYWGYNTIGFFAPHDAYSASGTRGEQVAEFKGMVKLLHRAGIEVLLDVVYNHTSEGGSGGPALSLRGLSPRGWYRDYDTTGCGNTLDLRQPDALLMVLDSLRYWVSEMHVDGFRFDLATALARGDHGYEQRSVFFAAIAQDPVLRNVKLIAEPWDIGPGGYQVGQFPAPWAEWNDRYRDLVRDYWRGASVPLGEIASRLSGSSDLFAGHGRRKPWTSVNFVTAHDGFCLEDLVSYNGKHNTANGEDNRDGTNDNRSWNCGVEGPVADDDAGEVIRVLRNRQRKNMLGTLLLSQGTPMLVAGDEFGRTQQGNNNAYCQDNALSWLDWSEVDADLLSFVQTILALRKRSPLLRQGDWLDDRHAQWFSPDGEPMTIDHWNDPGRNGLALHLTDSAPTDSLSPPIYLAMNEGTVDQSFTLPPGEWTLVASSDPTAFLWGESALLLCNRSMAVLELG
jgi:isoamylase